MEGGLHVDEHAVEEDSCISAPPHNYLGNRERDAIFLCKKGLRILCVSILAVGPTLQGFFDNCLMTSVLCV